MKRAGAVLTADVGGTKIRSAIITADNHVRLVRVVATPQSAKQPHLVKTLLALFQSYPRTSYTRIGIGFAGITTWPEGKILTAPSIPGIQNVPLKSTLQQRLKKPTVVDNDATLWTFGEALLGAGKGKRVVAGLMLGTGVGGGLVIDGQIFRGKHNAIEFGHMTVVGGGPTDRHGGRGHLESFAGGWSIERTYRGLTGQQKSGSEISAAARGGNRPAQRVIHQAANGLALGLTNILRVLDPNIIVLGGSLTRLHGLLRTAQAKLRRYIINPLYLDTPIVRAQLGDDAPLIGAALLARHNR